MASCVALVMPVARRPWQRKHSAVSALDEVTLAGGRQSETSTERGTRNSPGGAVLPQRPKLNPPATIVRETAPSTPSTPVEAVAAVREETLQAQQRKEPQQEPCSALGCMFRPELTKEGVVEVVSQVLCRPGFTLGGSDERRLLKSVTSGRIDIRTMSRILRWLAGERAARELRRRGIEFVGPKQGMVTAASPYTTGQGMTQLVKEVVARNGAGTRFIVCFSSRFDACSSAIAGVLVTAAFTTSGPAVDCSCPSPGSVSASGGSGGGGGAVSDDARTVSTCSSCSDTEDDDRLAACSTPVPVDLASETRRAASPNKGPGGTGGTAPGTPSRLVSCGGAKANNMSVGDGDGTRASCHDNSSRRGGVVALLLDEKPKHRLCSGGGDGGGGGNHRTAGFCGGDGGVVYGMPVHEWVEAYGECEGPMLAAWVLPGQEQS
eukprot:g3687.t1